MTARQLSRLLTGRFGPHFSDFVTGYRVAAATSFEHVKQCANSA